MSHYHDIQDLDIEDQDDRQLSENYPYDVIDSDPDQTDYYDADLEGDIIALEDDSSLESLEHFELNILFEEYLRDREARNDYD